MSFWDWERALYRSLFGELSPGWLNTLRNWGFFLFILIVGPLIAGALVAHAYTPEEPPRWAIWLAAAPFYGVLGWIWLGRDRD
jgi:hypothetical protein